MRISVTQGQLDHPDVQALLAFHVAEMHAHSPPEACHVMPGSALAHPAITFFTARDDERVLLGFGALRELGDGTGEIKSMRTAQGALGKGVGRAVLTAIIEEAVSRGYASLLLETGTTSDFAAANHLYNSTGFVVGEPFGGYPAGTFTRFLRLDL